MAGEDSSERGLRPAGEHGLSYKSSETPQVPKFSRRKFLGIGAVAAIALAAKKFGLIDKGVQTVKDSLNTEDPNWKKPIEGETKKLFVTDLYASQMEIPLRDNVIQNEGSIVGYTKPGFEIEAQAVLGTIYTVNPGDNLVPVRRDGRLYGRWYKIDSVPVYEKDKEGNLIAKTDKGGQQAKINGVYVSGNYLKLAASEQAVPSGK